MGWNSWYQFLCNINETLVLDTADAIIRHGLDKVGYNYVNLDDCWALVDRDDTGNVVVDPKAFPNGMMSLGKKLHEKGLKFGIYTDIGLKTCAGSMFFSFLFSYMVLKELEVTDIMIWTLPLTLVGRLILYDVSFSANFAGGFVTKEILDKPWNFYQNFSDFLNHTKRHMLFSICEWGLVDPATWAPKMSNSWRTTGDIGASRPFYKSVLDVTDINNKVYEYAGPYNFNDPDFLLIGVTDEGSLNYPESRAQFSLWAIMAAPLFLSLDLRGDVDKELLNILKNTEVIAINQDELGKQGYRVAENTVHIVANECIAEHCVWTQTYYRELEDEKQIAVLLLNHASRTESKSDKFSDEEITVKWEDIKLDPSEEMEVRELWTHQDLGSFTGSFKSTAIGQHDVQLLLLKRVNVK